MRIVPENQRIVEVGQRFGLLSVVGVPFFTQWKKQKAVCQCDCGNYSVASASDAKRGNVQSCGRCIHPTTTTHGGTGTRLFRIWSAIKTRCSNPKVINYRYYGGKGIAVCEEWKESFTAFRDWSMEHGYADNLEIDRIESDKGYSPENCQWITKLENIERARHSRCA